MQKSKVKIVDDFLSPFEFEPIRSKMESKDFPWYWQEHSHGNIINGNFIGDNVPQLIHGFVENGYTNSEFYFLLKCSSCLSHLGAKSFDKVKANCNFKTSESNIGWFHTDYEDKRKDESTTAILYMNTNNGGTKFEDGTFVNSVANRMVTFDASLKHAPVSCTDSNRRIVVNINYSKLKNE
tara:strand:- start:28 stop:570 length:543 start_codon:yes stop_codon:yes gene_type:complete